MTQINKILLYITIFTLTACGGTTPIKYQASLIDISEAKNIVEDLTWSQHRAWRPDSFEITDKYLAWGFGTVSKNRGIATVMGNTGVAIGSGSSRSRSIGDRSYYRSIESVELSSWSRKLKQYYVVSLRDSNNKVKFILHTKSAGDAKLFTDAMTSIVNYYKNEI